MYDFSGDGKLDIFVVGFLGMLVYWFKNLGDEYNNFWEWFVVFLVVDNEVFLFDDLIGDGVLELICILGGWLGYVLLCDG